MNTDRESGAPHAKELRELEGRVEALEALVIYLRQHIELVEGALNELEEELT